MQKDKNVNAATVEGETKTCNQCLLSLLEIYTDLSKAAPESLT